MRGPVIDSLHLLLGKQNIRDLYHLGTFERRTVERFLRRLRVELIHRKPTTFKTISEIEWTSARDYLFDTDDGQTNVAVNGISKNIGASITNINFRNTFCGHSLDLCNSLTYPCSHVLGGVLLCL